MATEPEPNWTETKAEEQSALVQIFSTEFSLFFQATGAAVSREKFIHKNLAINYNACLTEYFVLFMAERRKI